MIGSSFGHYQFTPGQQEAFVVSADTQNTLETVTFPDLLSTDADDDSMDPLRRELGLGSINRFLPRGASEIHVHAIASFGTPVDTPTQQTSLGDHIRPLPDEYLDVPVAGFGGTVHIVDSSKPDQPERYTIWKVYPGGPALKAVIARERLGRLEDIMDFGEGLREAMLERIDRSNEGLTGTELDTAMSLHQNVEAQTEIHVTGYEALEDPVIINANEARELGALLIEAETFGTEEPGLPWNY